MSKSFSKIVHKYRGLIYLFVSAIVVSIPGLNCHSQTDFLSVVDSYKRTEDQGSGLSSTRSPSSLQMDDDGALLGESKVRISNHVALNASQAKLRGLAAKLGAPDDAVIPKGTSLLVLYDNECRGKQNAALKFEAEKFKPADDTSLMALQAQAEADPCIMRIDENGELHLIKPLNPTEQAGFKAVADRGIQAALNDPRLAEARHFSFVKALTAWDLFFSGAAIGNTDYSEDVIVAVIDTGVLATHPDLTENAFKNSSGKNGYDYINNDDDPTDDNGHGTHVSGIIGARANNNEGVSGIMGTRVKIMGIKVLDANGSGGFDAISNGIRYAADQGAHVINMSLGGGSPVPAVRDAMTYATGKGVVLVVAAGNNNQQLSSTTFFTPASYAKDVPGAIAVGSVDAQSGVRSGFSNYSTQYVWIGAPGSNGILSTYLSNGYRDLQGTSMASPVVAGAAALLVGAFRSRGITYSAGDITNLLTDSARKVPSLESHFRDGATLDLERAAKLFFSRHVITSDGGAEEVR